MSNPVKFGYISGFNLVFSAYQEDGSGRGIQQQPLPELAEGYYGATPITDLVAGDEIIAYVLEDVYWEDDQVYVLTYDSIFWENDQISYEGAWVIDYDTTITDVVTSVGDVVGANEYSISASDFSSMIDDLETLIVGQNKVTNIYTASETGGGAAAQAQQVRELEETDIGYFRRKRIERYGS